MPVTRERQRRYPGGSLTSKTWRRIRVAMLMRAGHRCEGSPDHPDCRAVDREPHPDTGSPVVLTVAHLDHDPGNNQEDKPAGAWCQRCHLGHDREHHEQRRRANLRTALEAGRAAHDGGVT